MPVSSILWVNPDSLNHGRAALHKAVCLQPTGCLQLPLERSGLHQHDACWLCSMCLTRLLGWCV
jgi:hypothetical protein